ncbi:MAG: hypothetical protein LUH45_04630 [Clostridiales bacterium]|nr:hypothetical protein [Clostridiales bacterium]
MKKKRIALLVLVCAVAVGAAVLALSGTWGRRPFKNLSAEDIVTASVTLTPPGETVEIEAVEELAAGLNAVVIYRKDNSYTEYAGQSCVFSLTLADGTTLEVNAYNPFLIIDGVGYRCEYEPCEALNSFANRLLDEQ